jgi:oxygen-independent coproporphyrinogen-3 oxidase
MCSWAETLETVSRWGPEHVSAYELTLEPDTPLAGQVERGEITLPGEDTVVGMYWEAQRRLRAAGYVAYEISNLARPGCECRHNLVYWRNGEYLGFGASGCSFLDGVRTANLRDARAYVAAVEAGRSPVAETESLPPERALGETLMMGLRLRRGLSLGEVRERHGTDVEARFGPELGRLEALGLVERADGRLRLTERGVLVSNEVMACFV